MAITLVQSKPNKNASQNTVSVKWGTDTGLNNFLAIGVAAAGGVSITPQDAGWTSGPSITNGSNGITQLFYWAGAPIRLAVNAEVFNLSSPTNACTVATEWTGMATSSPTDGAAGTATGTNTSPLTGSTPMTTDGGDLIIGLTGLFSGSGLHAYQQSNPINSFTLSQAIENGFNATNYADLAFLYQIPGVTGTFNSGTTATNSSVWAGLIQAFLPGTLQVSSLWYPSAPDIIFDRNEIVAY